MAPRYIRTPIRPTPSYCCCCGRAAAIAAALYSTLRSSVLSLLAPTSGANTAQFAHNALLTQYGSWGTHCAHIRQPRPLILTPTHPHTGGNSTSSSGTSTSISGSSSSALTPPFGPTLATAVVGMLHSSCTVQEHVGIWITQCTSCTHKLCVAFGSHDTATTLRAAAHTSTHR